MCVCVSERERERVCVGVCVRARARVCVRACVRGVMLYHPSWEMFP